jgi:hypothetical protein
VGNSSIILTMTFRKLPGLPAYGPQALTFPNQWGMGAREGLVVEFTSDKGEIWVGNFQPGITGADEVLSHPNRRDVIVISNGALWIIDPTTRVATKVASAMVEYWRVSDPDGYVFNDQGLAFIRISAKGIMWDSRRISWDGFSELRIEGDRLSGLAWTPIDDAWLPFTLDLRTGLVEGGSYNGPEMHMGV